MKLVIEPMNTLPCRLEVFAINGKNANQNDFVYAYDHDIENAETDTCSVVRTDVWKGRVNHPEEHDIVRYTAIFWYREEFVGGVDLGRNYMHAKYKFFELVVNKKYILEMKHKKNENAR